MKTIGKLSLIILMVSLLTSCLEHGLPDYPAWEDHAIERVYVEYRYEGSNEMHGEPVVKVKNLVVEQTIDESSGKVNITVSVPEAEGGDFNEEERAKVSQDNLWLYVDISTAAIIEPLDDTPAFGDPTDLGKTLQYRVTAANGDEQDWTITMDSFVKD